MVLNFCSFSTLHTSFDSFAAISQSGWFCTVASVQTDFLFRFKDSFQKKEPIVWQVLQLMVARTGKENGKSVPFAPFCISQQRQCSRPNELTQYSRICLLWIRLVLSKRKQLSFSFTHQLNSILDKSVQVGGSALVDYRKVDCPQVVRNKLKVNHQQIERQTAICTRHFATNFFLQRKWKPKVTKLAMSCDNDTSKCR